MAVAGIAAGLGCGVDLGPSQGPTDAPPGAELIFRDVSAEAGIALGGPSYAAAAADFDRDGRPDLAVSRHGSIALFRNTGNGRFAEVDGVGEVSRVDTHGLSWFDVDRDGWLDLVVSIGAARGFGRGSNLVLRNGSGLGFEAVEDVAEVIRDPMGRGRCTCPADVTGDGAVELMVLNAPQRDRPHRLAKVNADGWSDVAHDVRLTGIEAECIRVITPANGAESLLVAYGAGRDSGRLYRRTPDGPLTDVSEALGVARTGSNVMAVATADVDNDGDLDLYLVKGLGIPREVRAEQGAIRFRLVSPQPGLRRGFVFRATGSIELDVEISGRRRPEMVFVGSTRTPLGELPWSADSAETVPAGPPVIDEESDRGVFLWREGDRLVLRFVGDGGRFRAAAGRVTAADSVVLVEELQPPAPTPATPNALFEYRDGRYVDVTPTSGVGDPASGRDAVFLDADNDGDLDLYLVNGGTAFVNQPDRLFRNDGGGRFTDVSESAGVMGPGKGRGASALAVDADGDGALDLFATNGDGPAPGNTGPWTLFRNQSRIGRWAEVDLVGPEKNPTAVGALLRVTVGNRVLVLERSATTGRFSTGVLPFHIGLGEERQASVEVFWPSGVRQSATVRAGQRLVITKR